MKRKTRSLNMNKVDDDISQVDVPRKKTCRGKNGSVKAALIHQQATEKTTIEQPVSAEQLTNINDENTPPPLIIDMEKETDSAQSKMPGYFSRKEVVGERLPRSTFNSTNRTQNYLSDNSTHVISNVNGAVSVDRSNKERSSEETLTPANDRSTTGQRTSNLGLQSSSRIIVSVDKRPRNSVRDLNHHQRTSTPIRPSRQDQSTTESFTHYNDSFSVDSIPTETYNMLSRFPEFRRLLRAYQNEKKNVKLARPSAAALNFLVELVNQIQQSSGRGDPRTDEQIARDLGLTPYFLMSLKDTSPQQSALNLFNHLYPGYEAKVILNSASNLDSSKPGLLNSILVFAQRSSPGTNYKLQELINALNNSIRGARHKWRGMKGSMDPATTLVENGNAHEMEIQDENSFDRIDDYATSAVNMDTNETQMERRFNDDECF